jgi:hypothetical protein
MSFWHQVIAEVIGGLAVVLIAWIFKMAQQDRKTFLRLQSDMDNIKNNHLAHIYYTLGLICKKLGIDYEGGFKL